MTAATQTSTDEQIGNRVHQLMWERRVTQTRLAAAMGMTPAGLNKKIRGHRPFSGAELVQVSEQLGVDVAKLFAGVRHQGLEPRTRWLSVPAGQVAA